MQILYWISICLISHGSSLNLNRPSSRWARSDDSSDGWKASNGPYFTPDPVSFASSTTFTPMSTTLRTIPARKVDEGSSFLPATSPEGFYEVVVGKKSPVSESMGSGPTGSPDVIIGRVMSTTGVTESATTTTTSVVGHPVQDNNNGFVEEKARERSDDDLIEMESRSSETSMIQKNQDFHPVLPPGSFFLPAVSRKADQYFSDSEQAIYIPLRRPDQSSPLYPVRTSVVLVNNKSQQQQPSPPPVIPSIVSYNSKDGDEEEEEEEDQDEDNEDEDNPAVDSVPPTKSHSSALDLVMTLYPNLPKLMSPSHFTSQGIKNLLKMSKLPAGSSGATSVIHETKVVTPPQGYLPQLPVKPIIGNNNNKPNNNIAHNQHKSAATNTQSVTQLTRSPSYYAPADQRHHPTATGSSGSFSKTAIQFTPFTPDDISPLNFLLPAPASSLSQLDKVTAATDQPETRSNNYGVLPSNGDLIAAEAAQNTASPLRIVPAPKLDFSWNLFQPSESQVSHQQTTTTGISQLPLVFGQQSNKEKSQEEQTKLESSGFHLLVPPGQTGEIVVRTQMATSAAGGENQNRPGISDSVDIITSYYDEGLAASNQKTWLANHHQQHVQTAPVLLPTLSDDKETTTTTTTTLSPITSSAEEVVTTTVSSKDVEPAVTSIPKLHGHFQPMVGKFPHGVEPPQDRSHHPDVPLVTQPPAIHVVKDEDDDVFSAPRVPDIVDDQHFAGSQIHETSVYEENLPRVQSANTEGEGKSSTPYYKAGKMSPKGAMYTVTQGHSKVKFFGFNALHNGELKPIDGKFFIFQPHQQDQQEPEWKFSPYLPVRLSAGVNPAFKLVPKKSIPISAGKKSSIRPVFFAKRPDGPTSFDTPWSGSSISEPFEYHDHLQKMAVQEQGRLPISQSSV